MDSIVKQRNDGFKAGEFLHRTTQLLPWPENVRFGYVCDLSSKVGVSSQNASAFPNPYDTEGGGFIDIHASSLKYYNKDGSIRWTLLKEDLPRNNVSFGGSGGHASIIHLINDVPHYIGKLSDNNNSSYYWLVKINLIDMTATISPSAYDNSQNINRFGILEDGTLYCNYTYSTTYRGSKLIDADTLTIGEAIPEVGIVRRLKSGWSSSASDYDYTGIALFNGSIALISGDIGASTVGGYTNDICAVLFGINPDLDMTTSKGGKLALRTKHPFAENMFDGELTQISKDLFVSRMMPQAGYWQLNNTSNKYFTRQALEEWESNCLYETTGFRIPLSISEGA